MPKYNYACHTCDHSFEIRLSYSEVDTAQPACPECGGADTARSLSRVNMQVARNGGSSAMGSAMGGGHSSGGGCGGCSGGNCGSCSH